jgi:hypothetical protein
MQADFEIFAERWHLPERAWKVAPARGTPHLYFTFLNWREEGEQDPRLMAPSDLTCINVRPVKINLRRPGSLTFDPTLETVDSAKKRVKKLVDQIYDDAQKQIESIAEKARAHGWSDDLPTRHRDSGERRLLAGRLFQRVVLQRTWPEIAKQEHCSVKAVMKSVETLSKDIGVPLPRKRGRRRKPTGGK